jgi:hypothetical protein
MVIVVTNVGKETRQYIRVVKTGSSSLLQLRLVLKNSLTTKCPVGKKSTEPGGALEPADIRSLPKTAPTRCWAAPLHNSVSRDLSVTARPEGK